MKVIVILAIFTSFLFSDIFFKNGDYVVDKVHNLHWQDTIDNITVLKSHSNAIKYCKNLELSGHNDWQLPTVEQYKYIIDRTRKDQLMINRRFEYILADDYWTQDTRWQSLGLYGFYVLFKSGNVYFDNKTHLRYVRCLRGSN